MKKGLLIIILTTLVSLSFGQAYDPSLGTTSSRSYAPAQGVPTDMRSMYWDRTLGVARPFQSIEEANASHTLAKYRLGNYPIYINLTGTLNVDGTFSGGTVEQYWYRDGVSDDDLVPMMPCTTTQWGSIVGVISDQADLDSALHTKELYITPGSTLEDPTVRFLNGYKNWQDLDSTIAGIINYVGSNDTILEMHLDTIVIGKKLRIPLTDTTHAKKGRGNIIYDTLQNEYYGYKLLAWKCFSCFDASNFISNQYATFESKRAKLDTVNAHTVVGDTIIVRTSKGYAMKTYQRDSVTFMTSILNEGNASASGTVWTVGSLESNLPGLGGRANFYFARSDFAGILNASNVSINGDMNIDYGGIFFGSSPNSWANNPYGRHTPAIQGSGASGLTITGSANYPNPIPYNTAGGDLHLGPGPSTGNSIGGYTRIVTTVPGAAGNTQTGVTDALVVNPGGVTQFFMPAWLVNLTKAQRNALSSPQPGWMIFQTDNTPGIRVYNGTNWMRFTETAD